MFGRLISHLYRKQHIIAFSLISAISASHLLSMTAQACKTKEQYVHDITQKYFISKIHIHGNVRVQNKTILSMLDIKEGQYCTVLDIDNSIKKLYSSTYFREADIRLNKQTLHIYLTEHPVIGTVVLKGNKLFKEEQLSPLLSARCSTGKMYNPSNIASIATMLTIIYQQYGMQTQVVPRITQKANNIVDITFYIKESPKTYIRKISFDGNKAFSEYKLQRTIFTSVFIPIHLILTPKSLYNDEALQIDAHLLNALYHQHGYLDFDVKDHYMQRSFDLKSGYLTYFISEGTQYIIRDITLKNEYKPLPMDEIRKIITLKKHHICDISTLQKNVQHISQMLFKKGCYGYNVVYDINKEAPYADICIKITKAPKKKIHRILIEGNYRTLAKVIMREMLQQEGDILSKELLDTSMTRLRNCGLFEEVTYTIEESDNEHEGCTIVISLKESQTWQFGLSIGFSTIEGLTAKANAMTNNFLGTGNTLGLSIDALGHNIGIIGRYFANKVCGYELLNCGLNVELMSSDGKSLNIPALSRPNELYQNCISSTQNISPYISGQLSPRLSYELGISLQHEYKIHLSQNTTHYDKDYDIRRWKVPIHLTLGYNRYIPAIKSYTILSTTQTVSLIGPRYTLHEAAAALAVPIGTHFSFHVYTAGGFLNEIKNCTMYDRFHMDETQIRGFDFVSVRKECNTHKSGVRSIGGNLFWQVNVCLKAHLSQKRGINIIGFIDSGNVYGVLKDYYKDQIDAHSFLTKSGHRHFGRLSIGIGLEWVRCPLGGPLTISWSFPTIASKYDSTHVFTMMPLNKQYKMIQHPSMYSHFV